MGESFSKSAPDTQDAMRRRSRRNFLSGTAAVGTIAIAGKYFLPGMFRMGKDYLAKQKKENFAEKVQVEIKSVIGDVEQGIRVQQKFSELTARHNELLNQSSSLDKQSPQYQELQREMAGLRREAAGYMMKLGSLSCGTLREANQSAEAFKSDADAVINLAVARILYREATDDDPAGEHELKYTHNCSAAYQELGKIGQAQIKQKMDALFQYAKANKIKLKFLEYHRSR